MNLVEVKEVLYDATECFFAGAAIIWTEQINTKPPVPYVTIKTGGIRRDNFPIIDEEGHSVYQCSTTLEVNLYTNGKPMPSGKNQTGNFIDTATSDLSEFAIFLDSERMTDFFSKRGVGILLMPPVRNLTGLQNSTQYRYRAMAEFAVSYVEEADGQYGISSMLMVPNSSGGGTSDMAAATTDAIENVELIEELEGGKDNAEQSIG